MVRQRSSGTGSAEESSDAPLEELDSGAEVDEDEAVEEEADDGGRSAATDALWTDVRVQPVEIALPSGVGYTLRAYRLSTELRPPDVSDRDEDDFPSRSAESALDEELDDRTALADMDEEELTAQALAAGREGEDGEASGEGKASGDGEDGEPRSDRHRAGDETGDETGDKADDEAGNKEAGNKADEEAGSDVEVEVDDAEEAEDVPVFLSEGGKLLLFHSPEGLAEYVQSGVRNELAQIDTWDEVCERIEPEDIVPLDEDRYELDLVVENLRGGHDVWDAPLIIQAGEIARDIGYALRVPAVMTALAPGSPLDDMDEGLRTIEAGGFGAFFARRKLRKIDAQTTAALGWRTIIGKISAVVDWRN